MKKLLRPLVVLGLITLIFGTIYATVQQSQRAEANQPQIELAQTTARTLDQGATVKSLGFNKIDAGTSLASFTIVYDKSGHPVAGNGYLHATLAAIPRGVLRSAENQPYNAVTWQSEPGLRFAAVSVAADKYYVVSARSLREVEKQETTTFQLAALGWAASLGLVGAAVWLDGRLKS